MIIKNFKTGEIIIQTQNPVFEKGGKIKKAMLCKSCNRSKSSK